MDEAEQKVFNELKVKAENLEVQVTKMVNPEEHQKIVAELEGIKATEAAKVEATRVATEAAKEQVLTAKRAELVKKGLPEDKVKNMNEEALAAAELVVTSWKPGADLGGGSGGSTLEGLSLFELGQLAYAKK